MATVPTYQRSETLRPVNQQGVSVQASGDDFGAQIGRGMQGVAQGIGDAGDAIARVNTLRAETDAKQARNGLMQEMDDILYNPETGFMNQTGKNALDGWNSTQDRIKAARDKYAQGLGPEAAKMFGDAATALETNARRSGMIHSGSEMKQYVISEGMAGAANFQNEALRHSADPAMADKYTAAAVSELRDVYAKQGLPPEAIELKTSEFLSDTTKKMALTLAAKGNDGVMAAKSYLDANQNRLTPGDKLTLDEALKAPLLAAKATRNAQALLAGAPLTDYSATSAPTAPAAATSAAAPSRRDEVERKPLPPVGGDLGSVLGSLKGMTEGKDAAAISSFMKNAAGISIDPRVTPWCAAFVNAVLATQGIEGTGKLNARSFMSFGMATDNPQPGDIVVFSRGNDPSKGHVGFFQGFDANGNIIVTGGNQSNSVKTSTYNKADLLGFRTAGNVNENTAKMPNYSPQGLSYLYDNLNKISDLEEREATRKQIDAMYTTQKKAMDAQQQQVQTWAEQQIIANPSLSVNDIPIEVQQTLGASGMTTLMNYQEKVRSSGEPTTDYKVLYELQTQYAQNPTAFAQADLFQYRDKLANKDWDTVNGWRQTALSDRRKADEEGSLFTSAFKQADQSLKGAGLTTAGIKSDNVQARNEMDARIGKFQSELNQRIVDFRAENNKNPSYAETQSMINGLLLPIVTQRQNWYGGVSEDNNGQFLFESQDREDGTSFEVRMPYADIPLDIRNAIKADIQRERMNWRGRGSAPEPTEEEVSGQYVRFLLGL